MKKLITLALIIGTTTFINAQSNLVFNQALIVKLTTSTEQIVPEGKVWKVESMNVAGGNILVDDSEWAIAVGGSFRNMPAWFPAGTSLKRPGSGSISNYLSVLEFNVVATSSSSGGSGGDSSSDISNGSLPGDDYTDGDPTTDNDGNSYQTVVIEGQTWTTTNLNVSTYRDGTPIPYISDFAEWQNALTGAYTYAGQNIEAGYGKLYNAYAIIGKHDTDPNTINKELAPEGFHIPTLSEWGILLSIYGGNTSDYSTVNTASDQAAYFLKSQISWTTSGNNESGLNIMKYPSISYGYQAGINFSEITVFEVIYGSSTVVNGFSESLILDGMKILESGMGRIDVTNRINNLYYTNATGCYIRLLKD